MSFHFKHFPEWLFAEFFTAVPVWPKTCTVAKVKGLKPHFPSCTFTFYADTSAFPIFNWYWVTGAHRAVIVTALPRTLLSAHWGPTSGNFPPRPFPGTNRPVLEVLYNWQPPRQDTNLTVLKRNLMLTVSDVNKTDHPKSRPGESELTSSQMRDRVSLPSLIACVGFVYAFRGQTF